LRSSTKLHLFKDVDDSYCLGTEVLDELNNHSIN